MKGFTPTAKHLGKVSGHQFPSKFGFSGSTGVVKTVKPYVRSVPMKKAEGGKVPTPPPKNDGLLGKAKDALTNRKSRLDAEIDKYAKGGRVDSPLVGREEPSNELDAESGGKSPLRPGFKRGGRSARKATGGQVRAAKGGKLTSGYRSKC